MITKEQERDLKENHGIQNAKLLIKETIDYFNLHRFPKDIKNYKQYLGFNLDRLFSIQDWQSNVSYPIGRSIIDTTFANMYDFGYEFGVMTEDIKKLLNETFDYKGQGRETLKDMIKEGLITGKAFCETSIVTEEIDFKLANEINIKQTIKKPTINYISKFNVFYDTDYNVSDSPFVIIRRVMSGKSVINKYSSLIDEKSKNKLETVIKENSEINNSEFKGFNQYDYNPVRELMTYQYSITKDIMQIKKKEETIKSVRNYFGSPGLIGGILKGTGQGSNEISYKNIFKYDKSKSYEVIEYREDGEIKLFVNGEYICTYKSLLGPLQKVREIEFNSIPGTSDALGIMDMIGDMQELLDSIWNSFIDNIKLQLTGMFKVKGNVTGAMNGNKLEFTKFGLLNLKGDSDIQRFEMGLGDFMPLNVIQFLDGFMSKMVGMNDYQLGGQHKVERVADGIDFMRSQYKSKLAVMIDSIQRLMADISREWILIYLTKFKKEELSKLGLKINTEEKVNELTGEVEETKYKINDAYIDDIINEENISFTYNALETIDMERDRERIMTLFQALVQNGETNKEELWNVALGKPFKDIWKKKNREGVNGIVGTPGQVEEPGLPNINVPENDLNALGEVLEEDQVYNSATIAKTPGGKNLRNITREIGTSDITDRLAI